MKMPQVRERLALSLQLPLCLAVSGLSLLTALAQPTKAAISFAAPPTFALGTTPSAAVSGDFNGDGKPT
ncbi:FG-GAP repeat domain-containing protein [Gloeobacter kilaueensis]|uniref:VCBS repeat-containing protein n=1 Tax=Gloeobacter kilaueensis (strain ATCC BAA-2537 / CCAP 1431/1 / ULC 316 / JS1) TaxID=1183438 RepID=U5QI09_GLOK1|nr:VCBS repeat-containing protein [Gloeobacter kilaueensis]AGY58561.1 hypothetical protein GKIL_2315 [Gloeobacter kilaueensis JS1]